MATYIYLRVSTNTQAFDQQMQDIKAYGIDPDSVDGIVEEHESGGKSYTDRKFQQLLNKCQAGDVIFAASTDRLGRSFVDMIRLMEDAQRRGVKVVACKQNLSLSDDNMTTKIILAITAIIDEDERKRIKHRTANKKAWQREQIAQQGYFIIEKGPNKGEKCTYVGSEKGRDTSAARAAAAQKAQDDVIRWKENSPAYKWVMDKAAENWSRNIIIEEFNKLHELQPDVFCTRNGMPLSKGVLSKWLREANPIALVV